MAPPSLFLRLAAWGGALGVVLVIGIVLVFYTVLLRHVNEEAYEHLRGKLDQGLHVLSDVQSPDTLIRERHRFDDILIGHSEMHLALLNAGSRTLLASSSSLAARSVQLSRSDSASREPIEWHVDDRPLLSMVAAGKAVDGSSVALVLTMDRTNDREFQVFFLRIAFAVSVVALSLALVGAWWITRRGLAPLGQFQKAVSQVSTQELDYRIAEAALPVELKPLAHSFNAMLARIGAGVVRLDQFSEDLAHELRTPLSALLGRTQVALSKTRTVDEYREVLAANVEEFERLSRMIDDMLFMARAENATVNLKRNTVDLNAEVRRLIEYLVPIVEERGVNIVVTGNATVCADAALVQRAVMNLLTNAIRHATGGGVIRVEIDASCDETHVTVINPGAPIPVHHRPKLFDRFYRVDAARSRAEGGAGLGLALVRSIMDLHDGSVAVLDAFEPGHTAFRLSFKGQS